MELEFENRKLFCMTPLVSSRLQQEQTQELRLPEGYPDIGRTLGAWGQCVLRSKQWNSEDMTVSGGVLAWVMYLPEDGSEMRSVEVWLPFQFEWNYPRQDREGTISASCFLSSVDARTLSARKLMVRANICAFGQAFVPGEVQIPQPGQMPEGVELLKNRYPLTLLREAGEKNFLLDEDITLSSGTAAKLLRYSLLPVVEETRIMGQKLVFRGKGLFHVLCRNGEGELFSEDVEIPFSQFTELEQDYGQETRAKMICSVTSLEPELGENGNVHLKCGITGQYTIMNEEMVELAEDGYGLGREAELHFGQLQIPAVLDDRDEETNGEAVLPGDAVTLLDVAFYPGEPKAYREGNGNTAALDGSFQILFLDNEGKLQCSTVKWTETVSLPQGQTGILFAAPSRMPAVSSGRVTIRMGFWQQVMEEETVPAVTGITVGDPLPRNPERPSLILQPAGEETLWQIAKACGSTVDLIKKANGLDREPDPARMLLIPVV